MKYIIKRAKIHFLPAIAAMMFILSSCNKDLEQFPVAAAVQGTTPTLSTLLDAADMTIFKAAVTRAGVMPNLAAPTLRYTVFAPNDVAMTSSGLSLAVVGGMPIANLTALVQYHIVPQTIASTSIPTTFPNFQYPTIFNPAPALSALLRLTTFPTRRNGAWVNNIPITALDIPAVNGVMHKVALVTAPPGRYLMDRINTDADLTLFKTLVNRADQAPPSIVGYLYNIGVNFTVFAPSNAAMRSLVNLLSGGLVPVAAPDATHMAFLSGSLPVANAQGLVFYHIMGVRAFSNNFPIVAASYPTLLNGSIAAHPGLSLVCTFTGPSVSAASVKGFGNTTTSNIAINPTPDPGGTSDQHFLNGTLHKIDQALRPQ
jgi:uncharacterized surface protein with fasciclin (FAS1) repeats